MYHLRPFTIALAALLCAWQVTAQQLPPRGARFAAGRRLDSTIQGNALTSSNQPVVDATMRLRNARSGHLVALTTSDRQGLFQFFGVEPGSYIVELVGSDQIVVATSDLLSVNSAETLSAIVKVPFRTSAFARVLGHSAASAMIVTAAAAASGVLATQVSGGEISPRR